MDFDSLEKYDPTTWEKGRIFLHVESGEFMVYEGLLTNPIIFQHTRNFVVFGNKTGTNDDLLLQYEEKVFDKIRSFKELENETSLRPFSVDIC